MIVVLYDFLGFERHRKEVKAPLQDVYIWGDSAYTRREEREDPAKPHEKFYVERSTGVIHDTPASGIYRRSDLYGPT